MFEHAVDGAWLVPITSGTFGQVQECVVSIPRFGLPVLECLQLAYPNPGAGAVSLARSVSWSKRGPPLLYDLPQ